MILLEPIDEAEKRVVIVNDAEFGSLSREEFMLLTGIVDRLIDSGARAVALQSYLLAKLER